MWCRRQRTHDSSLLSVASVLSILFSLASSGCIPDVHSSLLSDPAILQDEAITAAFAQVQQNLSSLFENTTSDGLSFAVVSTINYTFCPPSTTAYSRPARYTHPGQASPTHSTTAASG